jgi:hypothetical protein
VAHRTLLSFSELKESLREEFLFRYLRKNPAVPGIYAPKALLAALYLSCALLALVRLFRPGAAADRFFFLCLFFSAGFLTFLDAEKFQFGYLIYVSPLCMILGSGVICASPWKSLVWPFASFTALAVLVGVAAAAQPIVLDDYQRDYLPAVAFLRQTAGPGQMVLAPVPWVFAYGLDERPVRWLNVRSWPSTVPDFVVSAATDPMPGLFDGWRANDPAGYEKVAAHTTFELAYQTHGWLIYRRNP